MPSRAIEMRLQEAERELRALKLKTGELESRLEVLRAQWDREESAPERPVEPAVSKVPVAPPPLPPEDAPDPAVARTKPEAPAPEAPVVKETAPVPEPAAPITITSIRTALAEDEERPVEREGFELQLGRVWFVRIGIGLVLTGLVFLSTYAYQNFIINWDATSRVSLLYVLSAMLAGFGLFLERSKDNLRNYARVVSAGGFAALYYTTYAAHHVTALKIIGDPVVAAVLLTVCAGIFFVYATWRKSSTLTLTALLLAFYSVAINPMGSLGCFSGLLLAAIGVVFFLRNNWMHVGFTALAGAYASFAYWQGIINDTPGDPTRWFLVAYWLLFAAASLAPGARRIPDSALAVFVSLNNILAFVLFSFDLQALRWHADLGTYALTFGAVLLALALVLPRFPAHPAAVRQVYLAKGLALATWGLSIELSGYQLFVSLAVEAAVLALAWRRSRWPLFGFFAAAVALLASGVALHAKFLGAAEPPLLAWISAGGAFLAASWFTRGREAPGPDVDGLSLPSFGFASLALLVPSLGILTDLDPAEAGCWMLGIGLLFGACTLLLDRRWPLREAGWLSQPYAVIGAVLVLPGEAALSQLVASAAVLAALSYLHSWFANTRGDRELRVPSQFFQSGFALLFAVVLGRTLSEATDAPAHLLLSLAFLPLGFHALGSVTRNTAIALAPQLLYFPIATLVIQLLGSHHQPFASIESLAVLLAALGAAAHFAMTTGWERPVYRDGARLALFPLAAVLWLGWTACFVSHPQLLIAATGLALVFLPPAWRTLLTVPIAIAYLLIGLGLAAIDMGEPYWAAYLTLPFAFAAHLWMTRERVGGEPHPRPFAVLAIAVAAALAIIVSRHTLDLFDGHGLAVAWALLAVFFFAVGLGVRRRHYRWAGLVMIAATLGHVLTVEVWELDTVLRIVSFLTLGLVLLALGYVYNRWSAQIKRLL